MTQNQRIHSTIENKKIHSTTQSKRIYSTTSEQIRSIWIKSHSKVSDSVITSFFKWTFRSRKFGEHIIWLCIPSIRSKNFLPFCTLLFVKKEILSLRFKVISRRFFVCRNVRNSSKTLVCAIEKKKPERWQLYKVI